MDFLALAKQRCSIRTYQNTKVATEKLEKILEAAHVAPTAANMQSHRLLVIQSDEGLEKLSKGVNFHGAPLAIIVCGDHTDVFIRPFDKKSMVDIDAAIVADHMVLEAEDLGLSTCWLTYFEPTVIRNEFHIPNHLEPIAILAIGYGVETKASPNRHQTMRKSLDKITVYESF